MQERRTGVSRPRYPALLELPSSAFLGRAPRPKADKLELTETKVSISHSGSFGRPQVKL